MPMSLIRDLLAEFSNATADFYTREVVDEDEDAHGDSVDVVDWVPTHEDVSIRYQTSHTTTQADVFESGKRGDDEVIRPMIFVMGEIGEELSTGDRVDIEYRGRTLHKRITATDYLSQGFDDEGYVRAEVKDYGDS